MSQNSRNTHVLLSASALLDQVSITVADPSSLRNIYSNPISNVGAILPIPDTATAKVSTKLEDDYKVKAESKSFRRNLVKTICTKNIIIIHKLSIERSITTRHPLKEYGPEFRWRAQLSNHAKPSTVPIPHRHHTT